MLGPVFTDRRFDQIRLKFPGFAQGITFILDILGQLRQFQAHKELVDSGQRRRPQSGNLGHHIWQKQSRVR